MAGRLVISALMLASMALASCLYAAPAAWRDNATGFAIGGYDPVAYFTERKPRAGRTGIEHHWGALTWRFASIGNRDAFARHPKAYQPRFAGYDAEALARGFAVEGNPVVWAVHDTRVLFFRDSASLAKWRANPSRITALADANWKKLSRDLPGTSRY